MDFALVVAAVDEIFGFMTTILDEVAAQGEASQCDRACVLSDAFLAAHDAFMGEVARVRLGQAEEPACPILDAFMATTRAISDLADEVLDQAALRRLRGDDYA